MRETKLQTQRSVKEGKRYSRPQSRDSPGAHGEAGCLLQSMGVHGYGADIHLQNREDPTLEKAEMACRKLEPVESLCWSRLLAEAVANAADPT